MLVSLKFQVRLELPSSSPRRDIYLEAEFLRIAEKMKPHMQSRMRIEPFPWLRDYYVDMNKLYTELTLEKIENDLFGAGQRTLHGYKEMFDSVGRDKILTKGDPGMGKTTLSKKIGFDWTREIFKMFTVIFFVQLRLVKPDEPIENVILQQHPELKGLQVSAKNVRSMLERFGDRCLVILDGLDEHGLGQNEDVLKLIKNEILLDCGIVVSSRPHSVNEVEQHFPTIISVDGFTKQEAVKFVSNFFTVKKKVNKILNFKPSDSRENFPVHKCPILLSILCLLVKEKEINLSETSTTVGDLYLLMVQCLYKKFINRKRMQFVKSNFVTIMKSVGKLALQTLITKNPLLQKSEVLSIAGEFAFEYGFFAGHEDFRLCTDPVADVYVTYAHRSIEEFFGSFGFIQALNDGKSVDDILGSDCEKPIFMVNPLILSFCLWLLSTKHFDFSKQIYDKLASYVAKRIDCYTLDTQAVGRLFPAININNPYPENNRLTLKFFKDVFQKCVGISVLHVDQSPMVLLSSVKSTRIYPILGRLSPNILDKVTILSIDERLAPDFNIDSSVFNILMRTQITTDTHEALKVLLTKYNLLKRNPHVYLTVNDTTSSRADMMTLMTKDIKQLRLFTSVSGCTLFASGELPYCPLFTCFIAWHFCIDDSVPSAFMKAVKAGKFPHLRRIELNKCRINDCEWPDVPEFSMEMGKERQTGKIISQLSKLTLDYCSDINLLISKRLEKLAVVKARNATHHNLLQLNDIVRDDKLPNLSTLHVNTSTDKQRTNVGRFLNEFDPDHSENVEKLSLQGFIISSQELKLFCQKLPYWQLRELNMSETQGMTGNLSLLFTHSLPRLFTFTLKSCDLNSEDTQSLAQAKSDGKLPELRCLDISENPNFENIKE